MASYCETETKISVYVPDDHRVWKSAEILKINNDIPGNYLVKFNDCKEQKSISFGEEFATTDSFPLRNEIMLPKDGFEDMSELSYLHEASILENLEARFSHSHPYTYASDICIAINPFKWLNLYNTALKKDHMKAVQSNEINSLKPHVYNISSKAYKALKFSDRNQTILVSGESGSGKTETVKILMSHLAYANDHPSKQSNYIADKVLESNQLLESFGNAKTEKNDNSSRFGKFVHLYFDATKLTLIGSKTMTCLLEKTRVVSQNSTSIDDCNFHIFYQLLASPSAFKMKLHLLGKSENDFRYLIKSTDPTDFSNTNASTVEAQTTISEQSQQTELKRKSIINEETESFSNTLQSLDIFKINKSSQTNLFQALSGLLYLGEIQFIGDKDAPCINHSVVSNHMTNLTNCCSLLGLNLENLCNKLLRRSISASNIKSSKFGGDNENGTSIPLNMEQCMDCRDALAKDLYNRLFLWLVDQINLDTFNNAIDDNENANPNLTQSACNNNMKVISMLDIFGFESFHVNRFEQLCINFINEKLQLKYTEDVYNGVQKEYEKEKLIYSKKVSSPHSTIQQSIYTLFETRENGLLGLFPLLDEECMLPRGNDTNFLNRLLKSQNPVLVFQNRLDRKNIFHIKHYAGIVNYNVNSFVERNRDHLSFDVVALLSQSSNALIQSIYNNNDDDSKMQVGEVTPYTPNRIMINPASKSLATTPVNSFVTPFSPSHNVLTPYTPKNIPSIDEEKSISNLSNLKTPNNKRAPSFIRSQSVTTKVRFELDIMMRSIYETTDVHYIRCIKPNADQSASLFDRKKVVQQLRSLGVVEAIRITHACYPYRMLHSEFLNKFRLLKPLHVRSMNKLRTFSDAEKCVLYLKSFPNFLHSDNSSSGNSISTTVLSNSASTTSSTTTDNGKYACEVGLTKVFFPSSSHTIIEKLKSYLINYYAQRIQQTYRHAKFRQSSATKIQSLFRMQKCRKNYKNILFTILHGIIAIQANFRMKQQRGHYINYRFHTVSSIVVIQSWWRQLMSAKQQQALLKAEEKKRRKERRNRRNKTLTRISEFYHRTSGTGGTGTSSGRSRCVPCADSSSCAIQ